MRGEESILTSYEVTPKGHRLLEKHWMSSWKPTSKEEEVLLAIFYGGYVYPGRGRGGGARREVPKFTNLPRVLGTLERKSLIKRASSEVSDYIEKIPESSTREILSTYYKVGRGELVSDEELDRVLELVLDLHRCARPARDFKLHQEVLEELEEASTRSEKIIALDRTIGLAHWRGSWLIGPDKPTLSARGTFVEDPDFYQRMEGSEAVHKVLGKLSGE